MISGLRGKIKNIKQKYLDIEVNGISYRIFVPQSYVMLHKVDEVVEMRTYMHVAEGELSLYGFETEEEVDLFRMLLGVSGVGPKTGVSVFDNNGVEDIRQAVMNADVDFFKKVKGLGLKTAQKIIIELKNKIGSLKDLDLTLSNANLDQDEVYLSLIQLGFDKKISRQMIEKIPTDLNGVENRLSWCLKNITD